MLRLRPDKNITRSKMYIRTPDGGYMKIKMEYENYFKQY
jgi:hypothetical protein